MKQLYLLFFLISVFSTKAQITANGNDGVESTQYANGVTNDFIYIWKGTSYLAKNGSLTATPQGQSGTFTFNWFVHDKSNFSWSPLTTASGSSSTINQLGSGGYRVEILDSNNVIVACYVAWVWNMNLEIDADLTWNGCTSLDLNGSMDDTGSFTYYNPPAPTSIITSNTIITVCFNATHTFVSDLKFFLVGPVSAGSPIIELYNKNITCNSGNNISNLCFTSDSTAGDFVMCTAITPLTGTYKSFDGNLIDWSPLYGLNAAASDWKVQIFDCVGSDSGTLTRATLTFSNLPTSCGAPSTITYDSGIVNLPINDNSCSSSTASTFNVPSKDYSTPITIQANKTISWTSNNGNITDPTVLITTANNIPNGALNFTLQAQLTRGLVINSVSLTKNIIKEELTITSNVVNISCFGLVNGRIEANVSGGTAPYTFAWTNGITSITNEATNLAAGTYQVTVTDTNGCTLTRTFTITEPPLLIGTPTHVNVLCHGGTNGSATITVSGGTAPYTYAWNNGITSTTHQATNLAAGTYEVTVTDTNGCIIRQSFTITEPAMVVAPVIVSPQTFCNFTRVDGLQIPAGSYIIWYDTVTGGEPLLEHTVLNTGTYYAAQVVNGCEGSNRTAVNVVIDTVEAPYVNGNGTVYQIADFNGFNSDVVYDGADFTSVSDIFDLSSGYLISETAQVNSNIPTRYLPKNRFVASETVAGLRFKLQPYNQNNSLKLYQINDPLTLVAATTISNVHSIYILGGSGDGSTYLDITVQFSDGSSQLFSNSFLKDWFSGTNYEIKGLGRIWGGNIENNLNDPRLYKLTLPLNASNYSKTIQSISFNKTAGGVANIMAVSYKLGETVTVCDGTSLSDLNVVGSNVKWYADESVATTLSQSTLLTNQTTYYASQSLGTCESSRKPFYLNVTPLPSPPQANDQSFCLVDYKTVGDLIATGTAIKWYETATSTVALNVSDVLSSGTYFATQTVNGCESLQRTMVEVFISDIALTVNSNNVSCNGDNNGSATVTVSGGTAPYTYLWNDATAQTTATATGLEAGTYTVTVTDANNCTTTTNVTIAEPTLLEASIALTNVVNVSCFDGNDGEATVTVSGGTAPYTYLWNDTNTQTTATATGLAAGTYTVTVTDANNCITTTTVTIAEPVLLEASIALANVVNVSCFDGNDGEAMVTVSGGTAPYTYLWNDTNTQTTATATGLEAGTYTVTVTDANNCTTTTNVTIAEPTLLEASIALTNVVNVSCFDGNDGSAMVTVSGGTAPYTYLWNDANTQTTATATGLEAGTYTVTVTDANNCTTTTTVTIAEPVLLEASIALTNVVNVSCFDGNDGEAMVTVSGGTAPYTYLWNDANTQTTATATGLAAGTYTVTVTDANNCTTTTNVTIAEPTLLEASIALANVVNVSCFDGNDGEATVTVSGGTAPYTYLWNDTNTQTTATATGLAAGTYTVTVTDANNCTTTTNVTIAEPTLLEASIALANVVNVSCFDGNDGEAMVTVSGGTAPYTYLWNDANAQTTATATGLEAGTYTVTVTDANNCTTTTTVTIAEPLVLEASIALTNVVNVSCFDGNDGSAMVTVSGGTAPYTYLWNDTNAQTTATATGLVAGTYTVTVTDANNCTTTTNVTVTEPLVLEASIALANVVNVSCFDGNDGEATVTVLGGTAPYTYLWNDTNAQTTATATGLEAGTYTVTVTDANNCTTTTNVTITEPIAIDAPIALDQTFCMVERAEISNLVATGTDIQWYNVAVGGSALNKTNLLNTGTYYATQTINGCESLTRTAIQVIVIDTPPAIANNQQFCIDANATVADLIAVGVDLKWYNSVNATAIPLTTTDVLITGTYFVTQTIDGCESAIRTAVQVSVYNTIAPIASNQEFCITLNPTVNHLVANGTAVKWYNSATAGTALNPTDLLSNGIYYATQTLNGCESIMRTAVSVVINVPVQLTTTQINACSNTRVQNIIIEGFTHNQLKWYNSATSTSALVSSQLLTSATYYVSTFIGGCESARQPIQVTIAAVVPTPTASFQIVCSGTQLNELTVTKDPLATLRWYTSLQSLIPVSENTIVATGTYYVVQVIGDCESVRVAVQVQAVNVSIPTVFNLTMCEGTTIGDLNTGSTNYVWYVDNTTQTPLPDSFIITSGNYYIANKVSDCISERKLVATNVSTRPASPTGQAKQTFNYSARVANLKMNEPNLRWFATYNDAITQVNQLSANEFLKDATTYYAIAVGQNNCGSFIPTAVEVTINLGIQDLDLTQLNFYPNPVETVLNINYIEEIKEIQVYTITGQRVYFKEFNTNKVLVDMSRFSQGTYLIHIKTEKGQQFIKVVKK